MDLTYNFLDTSSHNNGNVMGITNNRDTTRSQSLSYDSLNRIATAKTSSTSGSNCWGETYTIDQWSNLTAIGAVSGYTGCTQESLSVGATANNQLTATGFTYDAAGNMTGDGTNAYGFNAESEIKSAASVNYTYDGDGNRVQKSNGKIYWYGAGTEILDESDSSGNFTDEYVFFGGKRVAHRVVSSGTIYYYAEDFLGTSRAITTSTGTLCYDADFYPYGGERVVTNTCAQNYKFEGKERDTETGNDDFGARYYNSRLGRWLSADWSAIPAPVPYANLTNPQTLNLYAMVSDNPETFADLDGHFGSQGEAAVTEQVDEELQQDSWTTHQTDLSANFAGVNKSAAEYYEKEEERKQKEKEKVEQRCAQYGCGGGTPQSGGLKPPPSGSPPIPLPPGKDGKPNKWEQVPGTQDQQYGPRWKPARPIDGERQPSAWWDPRDGWWSHEPANGGSREHYDRWGNRINMRNVAIAATAVGTAALAYRVYRVLRIVAIAAEAAAAF